MSARDRAAVALAAIESAKRRVAATLAEPRAAPPVRATALTMEEFRAELARPRCPCGGIKEPCRDGCGASRCHAPGHVCPGCGAKGGAV